jgi:imidazolonepropionase
MDVFCEKGFYTVEETDQLLEAASRYGLKPKIHCNQFHSMGAIEVAIKHRAVSVDHLEVLNENEMALLSHADTIATLLPSAPFFLHDSHRPPARKMIEKGIGIALASDYNPGTSPSGNMSFVWSLACIQLRMLPEEAFHALTINGAFALEWADELGSISKGKKASLYITKPMESLAEIPYYFGESRIRQTIIGEKIF